MDYDDDCSYVGLEGHPTEFNRDFYGLAEPVEEDHLCGEDDILRAVEEVEELLMGIKNVELPSTYKNRVYKGLKSVRITSPCLITQ